jgi:ferrous iron transport protein A
MVLPLFDFANGQIGIIHGVRAPANAPEWALWLAEIGFIPGEQVQIMTRAMPGGDPLVVRVGDSTFALRHAEAACIDAIALEAPEQESQP